MKNSDLIEKSRAHLQHLCLGIDNRRVGSEGNRQATRYFTDQVRPWGWEIESNPFEAMDWQSEGADLLCGAEGFACQASPYSLGCDENAVLTAAGTLQELEGVDAAGKILLLHGDLAGEQIMPKNFVFYNPEEHQKIISLLEASGALALVCATSYNPQTAGGIYPFPLFEDGDFNIPSVFMTQEEGQRLQSCLGRRVRLTSRARRIPSQGDQVTAAKGPVNTPRLIITAHIDAKTGSPGAIDNATGVTVLLLLAELLMEATPNTRIELVPFNGEDYYAVPGQMLWLKQNRERMHTLALNINIDGAGYHQGSSCFSFFNLPPDLQDQFAAILARHPSICEGPQWVQGDHSIFVQSGIPAVAVSSCWFLEHMDDQRITHTPADNPDIVNPAAPVEIALALADFIQGFRLQP
jgi:aminopeptidase YwaD